MDAIKICKTSNYTTISTAHFKERGMSLKAKGLLSLMLALPDGWACSVSGLPVGKGVSVGGKWVIC